MLSLIPLLHVLLQPPCTSLCCFQHHHSHLLLQPSFATVKCLSQLFRNIRMPWSPLQIYFTQYLSPRDLTSSNTPTDPPHPVKVCPMLQNKWVFIISMGEREEGEKGRGTWRRRRGYPKDEDKNNCIVHFLHMYFLREKVQFICETILKV